MSRFLKALLMRRYLSGGRNYSPYGDDDRLIRYQDGSTVDKPIYEQLPIDPEVIASQLNTPIRLNGYYPQNIEAVSPSPAQNVSNGSIIDYIKANSRWGDSSLQARRELGKKYGIYDIGTPTGNVNLLNKLREEDGFAPETHIVTSPTSPKKTTKDKKEDENVPPTNKPIEWAGQKFETVQDLADYMEKNKNKKRISNYITLPEVTVITSRKKKAPDYEVLPTNPKYSFPLSLLFPSLEKDPRDSIPGYREIMSKYGSRRNVLPRQFIR